MPTDSDHRIIHQAESGSIAIMAAFSLMMVILLTGMVYDFGSLFATRTELQEVADSAAMAGGRALGALYAGGAVDDGTQIANQPRKNFSDQQSFVPGASDKNFIHNVVNDAANENTAGGVLINIGTEDIAIGTWDTLTSTFTEDTQPANAVQVTARRDQTQNGPLAAFFGQFVNLTGYNVTATATAALTPLQYVPPAAPPAALPPGQIILPLGINQSLLTGNFCGTTLILNGDTVPPPCAPAGWTTFNNLATVQNFNAIVAAAVTPTPPTPQTMAGNIGNGGTSYFFGGPWNQQATGLRTIWDFYDPIPFPPDSPTTLAGSWETLLPVYQDNGGCLALTGQQVPIVGFVSVNIDGNTGFNQALITFQCNVVGTGRSGDVNDPNLAYGTFGSVPVLVQ